MFIVSLIHNKIFPVLSLVFLLLKSLRIVLKGKRYTRETGRQARLLLGLLGQQEHILTGEKNVKYKFWTNSRKIHANH